jgi:hypothetical protein
LLSTRRSEIEILMSSPDRATVGADQSIFDRDSVELREH